jgi:hypothetical protein
LKKLPAAIGSQYILNPFQKEKKMSPFNLNLNPQNIAQTFSRFVRAIVWFLLWATIALASLAATYVAVRGIWVAVKLAMKAIGI